MPGAGIKIVAQWDAASDVPWVINSWGGLYRWNGNTWIQKSGCAKDIAASMRSMSWGAMNLTASFWGTAIAGGD
jgi:hypothetical protein